MRLLVLSERVDDEGGTETYLRNVLPALRERGNDVCAIARSVRSPNAYGVEAHEVPWSDEHDAPSVTAASAVSEIARSFVPDAVAVHNVLDAAVLQAAARASRRFAYHVHDHRPFCPNGDRLYPQGGGICGLAMSAGACGFHSLVHGCAYGPRSRTMRLIGRREEVARIVRNAGATIAISEYVAGLVRRNGVRASYVHVLAPPLACGALANAAVPRPAEDAVLFAGRVVPSKGARSLVRALARVDARMRPVLRIAGNGPDLDATLALAAGCGVRVEALGWLDSFRLRDAYDRATIVAVPSTWGEPFGLVGIEGFARGRPVVAYDSGGIREWLRDDCGRLVPRGNEAALARAVLELLDVDTWRSCAEAALRTAATYSLDAHVSRLLAIYAGVA